MALCLIGLGSNLGDRSVNLVKAAKQLGQLRSTRLHRCSRFVETDPIGLSDLGGSPTRFLNAAAVLESDLSPHELLDELQRIERDLGRVRLGRWGSRSIDLDLLLYDAEVICDSKLVLPHPWMAVRQFVLEPAATIAPEMRHPLLDQRLDRLAHHLRASAPLALAVASRPLPDNARFGVATRSIEECAWRGTTLGVARPSLSSWSTTWADLQPGPGLLWAVPDKLDQSEGELVPIGEVDPKPRILIGRVDTADQWVPWQAGERDGDSGWIPAISSSGIPWVLIADGAGAQRETCAAVTGML